MHYSNIEWQDDTGGAGMHFDCDASPTSTATLCNNGPTGGGQFIHFDRAFIGSCVGAVTAAAATSDVLAVSGMTAAGHCEQQPVNAAAAAMAVTSPGVYVNAGMGTVSVHHSAAAGAVFNLFCSFN